MIEYIGLTATFDARDTQRALEGSGIERPAARDYAGKLWDYWERHLDPDLFTATARSRAPSTAGPSSSRARRAASAAPRP